MNRLLSYFDKDRYVTIRIIYDVYDNSKDPFPIEESKEEFAKALSKLIPFLKIKNILEAKPYVLVDNSNVLLEFHCYNDSTETFEPSLPDYPCPLAVTGGFDETENLAAILNVDWLLCLSPYRFIKYKSLNTIYKREKTTADGMLLGPEYDYNGTKIVENKTGFYGESFSKRGFYYPPQELNPLFWNKYEKVDPLKYKLVNEILRLRESDEPVELMPVYFSHGRIYCEADEALFNLVASLFIYKLFQTELMQPKKCTVVIVFGGFEDDDYKKLIRMIRIGSESYPYLTKFNKRIFAKDIKDKFKIIEGNANIETINKAIDEATEEGVVMVKLGIMPNYISNYLFTTVADLPAVFEGEGSASLLLNAGKPFLHLVSTDIRDLVLRTKNSSYLIENNFYPTVPLNALKDPNADKCDGISVDLVTNYLKWEKRLRDGNKDNDYEEFDDDEDYDENEKFPGQEIGQFLIESYDEHYGECRYFKNLKEFYHQPSNDKLMMALNYLLNQINAVPAERI